MKKNIEKNKLLLTHFLFFILLVFTGFIIYSNSFLCSFNFDDLLDIVNNKSIKNLSDFQSIFQYCPSRFVGFFSFALNYYFNNYNVWGYHIINIIIHIINSMLIFLLSMKCLNYSNQKTSFSDTQKLYLAMLISLLFLTHPLMTQSVTYIVQRLASLATMFYFSSLFFYLKARESKSGQSVTYFILSLISALSGIFTKEIVFTLPLIIILLEFVLISRLNLKKIIYNYRFIIFFILIISIVTPLLFIFNLNIFNNTQPQQGHNYSLSPYSYLLTQFRVIITYIRLFLFPFNQCLDYDYPISSSFFDLKTFFSFFFLFILFIFSLFIYKKNNIIAFGIWWFYITLSVESSFIPIPNVIFEHRCYLPAFGFFISIISATFYFFPKKYYFFIYSLLIALIISLSFLTFNRNKVWKDDLTLWSDCVQKYPSKVRALDNLGYAYFNRAYYNNALFYFDKAIKLNPLYEFPWNNKGNALFFLKNYKDAVKCFSKAITLKPDNPNFYINRANAFFALSEYYSAIFDYSFAISLSPLNTIAWNNRAYTKNFINDYYGALFDSNKAIQLDFSFFEAYNTRGFTYYNIKLYNLALADFNKSIFLNSNNPDSYLNRAKTYIKLNNLYKACDDLYFIAKYPLPETKILIDKYCNN